MRPDIGKVLRTAQSYFPALKRSKDTFYRVSRRILRKPHEPDFKILPLLDLGGGSIVDVGANHGQTIESVRLFRPDAAITSFEANPHLAATLSARYERDASVTIRPVGLSDRSGTFTLYVPSYRGFVYDGLASLSRDEAFGWLSRETIYGFDPRHLHLDEVTCSVETLDAQKLSPSLIKIDVQGLEYEVLKGGYDTLREHEPYVLIEDLARNARVLELMNGLGYRAYHIVDGRLLPGVGRSANSLLATVRHGRALPLP